MRNKVLLPVFIALLFTSNISHALSLNYGEIINSGSGFAAVVHKTTGRVSDMHECLGGCTYPTDVTLTAELDGNSATYEASYTLVENNYFSFSQSGFVSDNFDYHNYNAFSNGDTLVFVDFWIQSDKTFFTPLTYDFLESNPGGVSQLAFCKRVGNSICPTDVLRLFGNASGQIDIETNRIYTMVFQLSRDALGVDTENGVFSFSRSLSVQLKVVPEPSSLLLLSLGLAGIRITRRRKG